MNDRIDEVDRISVRATRMQTERLLSWSALFTERLWAVEGAGGFDCLLARQLVVVGETVVDVPATRARADPVRQNRGHAGADVSDGVDLFVCSARLAAGVPISTGSKPRERPDQSASHRLQTTNVRHRVRRRTLRWLRDHFRVPLPPRW